MIWHSTPLDQVLKELSADKARGLSGDEAEKRLRVYGENRLLDKKPRTIIERFAEQFKDFMVLILMIAAVISMVTTILDGGKDWIEPVVIVAIVIINAVLGVVQESRAEAALDALKKMSAPSAKVYREGKILNIPSEKLVPGDILLLEAGDAVPADGRLIESASLRCDESSLTGESLPAEKSTEEITSDMAGIGDRHNMVYNGCAVAYGRGKAVVTETGMNTEMGKIAGMLAGTESTETPLQKKLRQLGKMLGLVSLGICLVIFVVGMIQKTPWLEMFMVAVSLAVAAIPEGLPAIVTVVLAIGVQRMVKKNAIIRRLPAVETLGSASVICSDKTGTLTQNRMTVTALYSGHGIVDLNEDISLPEDAGMLLRLGAMCCDGRVERRGDKDVAIGDPTETGIVGAALKYLNTTQDVLNTEYPRMGEIPFDSDRKLMTTVNLIDGKPFAVVKGAPDILISRCIHGKLESALKANETMAKQALRVICVAFKPLSSVPPNPTSEDMENNLTFAGLIGMIDPPREEAMEAVKRCKSAGIIPVMITGDHVVTAAAIARQLGILEDGAGCVTGAELTRMSDGELARNIKRIRVYARVTPEDKIRIVQAWQKKGSIVAMTGDGVNDAPALKAADIGCAMGITGTDVAKGAAAMILTDDNFASIVTAVEQGRGIFDNIKKAVGFLLSCNFGEIIAVFATVLLGWGSPLLPVQLLWINLVTDSFPALALGMEPVDPGVMKRRPRDPNENVLAGGIGVNAVFHGIMFAGITLAAFFIGLNFQPELHGGANLDYARTMAFVVLAFSQLVHAWNARSARSLFKIGFHTNKPMLAAFAGSVALMLLVVFTPMRSLFKLVEMDASHWLWVVLLSLVPFVLIEAVKLVQWLVRERGKTD
ncbi:MAG TPA: calcium-translocating P-type ATPase, PMCA-type [Ruminococcaceae bacterium]|nr:calcium-translocating P-type ATPase, PMCA-type [Oscillospiraceae bacterium]